MAINCAHYCFTVAQYERMGAVGILHEDDRVELIDGEIVEMAAQSAKHVFCVNRINAILTRALENPERVSGQNAIRLNDATAPQPDFSILEDGIPEDRLPTAADVLLVIEVFEVCDSSLHYDRTEKLPRYARAGIPEAWLVDLEGERMERHSNPDPTGYQFVALADRGETIASTVLPEVRFVVDAVLGPRRD